MRVRIVPGSSRSRRVRRSSAGRTTLAEEVPDAVGRSGTGSWGERRTPRLPGWQGKEVEVTWGLLIGWMGDGGG